MKLSRDTLTTLGQLSQLDLSLDEQDELLDELAKILEAVAGLPEDSPKPYVVSTAPLRPDQPLPCLQPGDFLSQAPATHAGSFVVANFIESGS